MAGVNLLKSSQWLCRTSLRFRIQPLSTTVHRASDEMASEIDSESVSLSKTERKTVNLAVKAYLERKRKYDAFMTIERSEFDLGQKHLANMMGMDYESMEQVDIDKAIEYLFPSGLYEESARALMKPPEQVYPKQKEAEFDGEGRPHQTFFFTNKPNYNKMLYDVVETLEKLAHLNDRLIQQGVFPQKNLMLNEVNLSGTDWLSKAALEKSLLEDLNDEQYNELIMALDRLTFQHFSYKVRDFIFQHRASTSIIQSKTETMEPITAVDGRLYVEAMGQKKTACVKVRVTNSGTGKFAVMNLAQPENIMDITYFYGLKERMAVMYPLQFTKLLGQVDVEVVLNFGGAASQAAAIRYAISVCLKSFVSEETISEMTLAGLLTQDVRVKERNKPGQEGARRKYTWKKR
eukprot:maker-scaffold83_size396513-snap-gene-1.21 protein:Tk00963 transcript:maker-scaffold83_size396513-snap-gene-1.21-mRNA-1 annotation:"unknown"